MNLPLNTSSIELIVPEGVAVETDVSVSLDVLVRSGLTDDVDVVIVSGE